jgi:poly(A) polymerase
VRFIIPQMPQPLSSVLPVSLPQHAIDSDALMVCRRLQEAGYVTYLVGGCVRDIILGRSPKDFDVGTEATPPQVRKLFRNCRLIGRRFRLAHVTFGPKIIEVATFRGEVPEDAGEDAMLTHANNFGTPEEDSRRRDFTVNGLFYDPIAQRVIDHVDGYQDLRKRVLRTIGDPVTRFREDPVRILRAVKFAARLGFRIDDPERKAMTQVATDLSKCSVPRVSEEIYRLGECGHASAAFGLMADHRVLDVILPEIGAFVDDNRESYLGLLSELDRMSRAHGALPRDMVLSILYLPLARAFVTESDVPPGPAWAAAVQDWFHPMGVRMHIAVKHRMRLQSMMSILGRAAALSDAAVDGESTAGPKRKPRLSSSERRALPQTLSLMRMLHRQEGGLDALYAFWRDLANESEAPWVPVSSPASMARDDEPAGRSRRGGRGRRRPGRNSS